MRGSVDVGRAWPVMPLVMWCGVLAGCSAGGQPAAQGPSQPPPASAPSGMGDPGVGTGAGAGHASSSAGQSPADAALRLEALLGQHAVLAADMMRGRIRSDEDFGQAANAAIGQNTDELAAVVGALGGEQAAGEFRGGCGCQKRCTRHATC